MFVDRASDLNPLSEKTKVEDARNHCVARLGAGGSIFVSKSELKDGADSFWGGRIQLVLRELSKSAKILRAPSLKNLSIKTTVDKLKLKADLGTS